MKFRFRVANILLIILSIILAMVFIKFLFETQQGITKTYFINNTDIMINEQSKNLLFKNFDYFNTSALKPVKVHKKKVIILYNIPGFMVSRTKQNVIYGNCEYKNCIFSRDRKLLLTADAIIFYVGIKDEPMGWQPPIKKNLRHKNQIWIFTATEPPEHYYNRDYLSPLWHNTMNWSSLYRLDSDIPIPYGAMIKQKNQVEIGYESVFNVKTKNALWYVSHCQVASERRLYVNEMIRHGFDIDILGGCGPDGRKTKTNNTEFEQTIPMYKFYLAFENSLCKDYITEKLFRNYNYNWIIIVRGGADYHKLIPTGTFINTADFPNVKALVDYLSVLGRDKEMYINFLKKKDQYTSLHKPFNRNCDICRKLNNLSLDRKTYSNIGDYINNGQCKRVSDL